MKKEMEKVVKVNDQEVTIVVRQPTNKVIKGSDAYKNKTWGKAIQDGMLTKKELGVLMRERGIWDDKKDKEEEQISKKIAQLERDLYHGKGGKKPKLSEGRDIAVQIRRERLNLRDLIAERISLEENTADSLADNAKFDYLVAHCTFHKNGSPVWRSFEEYDNQSANEIAFAAGEMLGKMLYNLDTSFEKNLPENKFLLNFGLVNDDLSLVDPNDPDQLVDTEGNKIDENGYYLDEKGDRVDKNGFAIQEDGLYELADYDNDLVVKPKRTRKRKATTKKEPVEETTES